MPSFELMWIPLDGRAEKFAHICEGMSFVNGAS
jgi:hypothetical protein